MKSARTRSVMSVVVAPICAVAVGLGMAALPGAHEPLAFAAGLHAVIPLWVGFACALPLIPGRRPK